MVTDAAHQHEQLRQILAASPVGEVLPAIAAVGLPDWWLAGGAVRNTVWRALFGPECGLRIKDFDVAFFDAAGDRAQELAAKAQLSAQFPQYEFDVKNQASFAVWRAGRQTYTSSEDGVANWLHTATAVGVRIDGAGQWQVFAPYGLDDLFQGIIRPSPAHTANPDAQQKGEGFLAKCPMLKQV